MSRNHAPRWIAYAAGGLLTGSLALLGLLRGGAGIGGTGSSTTHAADAHVGHAHPHGKSTVTREVDPTDLSYTYAIGAFRPEYEPPAPGSYSLPVIQKVRDHALLDVDARPTTLFALKADRLAVVAFVYTSCSEATGCPLSEAVMQRLDAVIAADPELSRQVTLITISFDPQRDTPARMKETRAFHEPKTDWHFVTTGNEDQLRPLLADFNQPVAKLRFADGRWSGLYRHVLKVFLLDGQNCVRNIYSVGFLSAPLVLADLRTLLLDGAGPAEETPSLSERKQHSSLGPSVT